MTKKQGKTKEAYIVEINNLVETRMIYKQFVEGVPIKIRKYIEGNLHTKLRLATLKKILKTLMEVR